VPYHYGSWDYAPGWGWVWYPGVRYAPAWVYWYWGPSYTGWCPIGYYSRHYGSRYYGHHGWDLTRGFRFGIHGWAGGSRRHWDRWNFVDSRHLDDRRLAHHTRPGSQLGTGDLPRGVITTDTRDIRRAVATRPAEGMRVLSAVSRPGAAVRRELPDITRFVARDPDVPADVARRALPIAPVGPSDGGGRGIAVRPRGDAPEDGGAAGSGDGVRGLPTRPAVRRTPDGPDRSEAPVGGARRAVPGGRSGEGDAPGAVRDGDGGAVEGGRSVPTRRVTPPAARPDGGSRSVRPGGRPVDGGDGAAPAVRPDPPASGDSVRRARPPATRSGGGSPADGGRERAVQPPSERPPGRQAIAPRPDGGGSDDGGSAVRRAAPPPAQWRGGSGSAGGPDGSSPRVVPPVRRVVEGVRRPEARSGQAPARPEPPPSTAPSRSGSYGASRPAPTYRAPSSGSSSGDSGAARSRGSSGDSGGSARASESSGGSRGSARSRQQDDDPDRN
jgi:hypothetical protein